MTEQLTLFNVLDFDIWLNLYKKLLKTNIKEWDFDIFIDFPAKLLRLLCTTFNLPFSGTKKTLIARLQEFANGLDLLARLEAGSKVLSLEIRKFLDFFHVSNSYMNKAAKILRLKTFYSCASDKKQIRRRLDDFLSCGRSW